MNGMRPFPPDVCHGEKKKRNYKLLVDPALKKGTERVYRYDGLVPGHESLYPPVQVRDPRSRLAMLWTKSEPADLLVPRFKIDQHYVGTPPPIQVTICNLNDNINKQFLDDLLKKFGPLEQSQIYYHPKTQKHLRLAHATFSSPQSAKMCIEKLNDTSVMGDMLSVYLDPFGKDCFRIFEDTISGRSRTLSSSEDQSFIISDPRSNDPRRRASSFDQEKKPNDTEIKKLNPEIVRTLNCDQSTPSSDLGYGSESMNISVKLSDRSASVHSDISNYSSHSTPVNFDSGFTNKYGNHSHTKHAVSNSQQKQFGWEKRSVLQSAASSWEDDASPAWENHTPKCHTTPPSTPVSLPKQSPTRESLDSRIELLLKQTEGKKSFLDLNSVSMQLGDIANKGTLCVGSDKRLMRPPDDPTWVHDVPPLPPDSSPLPPLPECDEPPPPPPEEDSEQILSMPPSPFISLSEYHKWALITRDIDSGNIASLSDILSKQECQDSNSTALKGIRLTGIQWNSEDVSKENKCDSPISEAKGDSTPVMDEPPDDVLIQAGSKDRHSDDDDKMSLSSLSSGDDKLEINVPHVINGVHQAETSSYAQSRVGGSNFNTLYTPQTIGPTIYPETAQYSATAFHTYPTTGTSSFSGHSSSAALYPTSSSTQFSPQNLTQNLYPSTVPVSSVSVQPITSVPSVAYLPENSSHSQPSSTAIHPMYPSEQVQMMARMGIWRPGMGSAMSASFTTSPSMYDDQTSESYVDHHYYSKVSSPSTDSVYSKANPSYTSSSFSNFFSRPPPGYLHMQNTQTVQGTADISYPLQSPCSDLQMYDKRDPNNLTINGVLGNVVKELKQVMKKDLCKKMIEASAFKRFEQWWDDHQFQEKAKIEGDVKSNDPKITVETSKLQVFSSLNALFDPNSKSTSYGFGLDSYGIGLGLRATMPRMPSFRRKIIKKPSSPTLDDDDSKKVDDSDVEKDKSDSDTESSFGQRQRRVVFSTEEEQSTQSESEKADSEMESSSEESSESGSSSEESDFGSDESDMESNEEDAEIEASNEAVGTEDEDMTSKDAVVEMDITPEKQNVVKSDFLCTLKTEHSADKRKTDFKDVLEKNLIEELDFVVSGEKDVLKQEVSPAKQDKPVVEEMEIDKEEFTDISNGQNDELLERETSFSSEIENNNENYKSESSVSSSEKAELPTKIPQINEDSRTIEASQALMALASSFTDFRNEPVDDIPPCEMEEVHREEIKDLPSEDFITEPKLREGTIINGDVDKSPDATLSADEILQFEEGYVSVDNDDDDGSYFAPDNGTSLASQLISEHNYCLTKMGLFQKSTQASSIEQKISTIDSVIDLVARGPAQLVVDHEYTKIPSLSSPVQTSTPSLLSAKTRRKTEKNKRKRRASKANINMREHILDDSKYSFMKRNLVEEMNILYEFLKSGVEGEDVQYAQKSYDAFLQDDTQGCWLNDTHWVEHPPNIPSPSKKKKKRRKCANACLWLC